MPFKKLSLWDGVSVVVGIVIGSGIFLVPSDISASVGTPASLIWIWVAAGALSLFGALSYAELGAALPAAGGQYAYLKEAYGQLWAYLYGWSLFWVAQSGSIAAVGVGFGTYLGHFFALPEIALQMTYPFHFAISGAQLSAAVLILLLTCLNCIGLRHGAFLQNLFTAMKILACVSMVVIAVVAGSRPAGALLAGGSARHGLSYLASFGIAMVAALWAYDGWNNVTFLAGECRDPRKEVPRALLLGTGAVVLIYIAMNLAYLRILDITQIAGSKMVAADAMSLVIGARGTSLIAAFILVSTFGCVNGMILAGARVYHAQAEDGLFPRRMAAIHPRLGTPVFSLLAQGVWSAILALSGRYDQLFTFAIFSLWIFYGMSVAAVFIFRGRAHGVTAGYRVPSIIPAAFLLLCTALLVSAVVQTPWESLTGLGLIVAGLPAYAIFRKSAMPRTPDGYR